MNLAYIVLAHQHPELVVRLIKHLISNGSSVVLHYDLNGGEDGFNEIKNDLKNFEEHVRYADRIKVGWGEWSITKATLNALEKLSDLPIYPDYVHLSSGVDYPIRPESEFKEFLTQNEGIEFIQAVNIKKEQWVTGGLSHERYQYKHPFNWQKNKRLFDWNFKLQKLLKLKRKFPSHLTPHMGSQWWTLTGETCQGILELSQDNALIEFFKTVWIPDEMYIQTLVAKLVTEEKIANKCLTLYEFNHNGLPLVFTNGHFNYLTKQPFFFARKISPFADTLRDELDELNISGNHIQPIPSYRDAGIVGNEYTIFYKNAGNKHKKGRRIIGHVEDQWYGDLKWNDKNYFVITGASITELKLLQEAINQVPGLVCHGELFNPKKVDFIQNTSEYDSFKSTNIQLRDHSKMNFLTQVINADPEETVLFLLPYAQAGELLDVCIWDPNAKIIHVESSPLLTYKESSILDLQNIDDQNTYLVEDEFLTVFDDFIHQKDKINHNINRANSTHWNLCLYDTQRYFGYELLHFMYDCGEIENFTDNITYQLLFTEYAANYMMLHESSNELQEVVLSSIHNAERKRLQAFFAKTNAIKQKASNQTIDANRLAFKPEIAVIGPSKSGLRRIEACLHDMVGVDFSTILPKDDSVNETYSNFTASSNTITTLFIQYKQNNHLQKILENKNTLFILIQGDEEDAYQEMHFDSTSNEEGLLTEYLKKSFSDRIHYYEQHFLENIKESVVFKADINKSAEVCKLELKDFLSDNYIIHTK